MFQLKFPRGSNTALTDDNVSFSFDELHQLRDIISSDFLHALPKHPIRVLGCFNDDATAIIALLTITELCDFMPINPQLTEAEVREIVHNSNSVDVAIISSNLMEKHAETMSEIIPTILDWDKIVENAKNCLNKQETIAQKKSKLANLSLAKPGRLILHTSGSTGTPKRVPVSLKAINASAVNIAENHQLTNHDLALNTLPTFHIGALVDVLLAPFHKGGSVAVTPNRTPNELADTLIKIRPTWVQLVPTILRRLVEDVSAEVLKDAGRTLSFVRCISAPLPTDLKHKASELLGCPIIEMYGMTETAGQIVTNSRSGLSKDNSVGKPNNIPVILLDGFGNAVEKGKVGEVCVSGETVFQGYEGISRSGIFFDEWFRTGDLGEFDSDGYLFLRGRLKEMINVGGEKVSPQEIETAAVLHPDVLEAASYALPHPTLGEQVGLTIACSKEVDTSIISEHLKLLLADFKTPRKILQVRELPRLPNAKVDRILLKRKGEKALLDRNLNSSDKDSESRELSSVEMAIGDLWCKELNSRWPEGKDDFFDMGGDSLSATSFLLSLEKTLERKISPSQLFETPTFESLVKNLTISKTHKEKEKPVSVRFLEQQMAGWPVGPYLKGGLFRGAGTLKSGEILFWSLQSFEEFRRFSESLGKTRPIYTTRSLYQQPNRSEQDFLELAKALADEIQLIQPTGEISLGGFCGGASVMHHVAERLEVLERKVKLFLSFDYWMDRPTCFPVLHAMSNSTSNSARLLYKKYEYALPHLHPNGAKVIPINCNHLEFTPESLASHLSEINKLIKIPESFEKALTSPQNLVWSLADRKRTPSAAIKIKSFSRFFKPGGVSRLKLIIQNTSGQKWLRTEESGLSVAVKLLNLDLHARDHIAGYSDFPRSVEPGEEIQIELDVQFPLLKLPFFVEILLSNQGVNYFPEKSSGRRRHFVLPNPLKQ